MPGARSVRVCCSSVREDALELRVVPELTTWSGSPCTEPHAIALMESGPRERLGELPRSCELRPDYAKAFKQSGNALAGGAAIPMRLCAAAPIFARPFWAGGRRCVKLDDHQWRGGQFRLAPDALG